MIQFPRRRSRYSIDSDTASNTSPSTWSNSTTSNSHDGSRIEDPRDVEGASTQRLLVQRRRVVRRSRFERVVPGPAVLEVQRAQTPSQIGRERALRPGPPLRPSTRPTPARRWDRARRQEGLVCADPIEAMMKLEGMIVVADSKTEPSGGVAARFKRSAIRQTRRTSPSDPAEPSDRTPTWHRHGTRRRRPIQLKAR